MKAGVTYTILIFSFFFQSFFSNASEIKDMNTYVANTASVVRNSIEENKRLAEIGAGARGTYFIDQRLSLDGIATVDTSTASLYNRNLHQRYQGDVIILLHIIYPEGAGGKKDVIDSTLLFSQRISTLSDPQHNKTIIHFWSVIDYNAQLLYSYEHIIKGVNINPSIEFDLSTIRNQVTSCTNLVCSIDKYAGIGESSQVSFTFKYNFLDPAGRVFTTNNGDVQVLMAIEAGPLLAFKFIDSPIYKATFSGEMFTGYVSLDGHKYTQVFDSENGIDNNYRIQVPFKTTNSSGHEILKWYSILAIKGGDVLSDSQILKCNNCSSNTDNTSPIIGIADPIFKENAQVFLSGDLVNGNIILSTYLRDVALTDGSVIAIESSTFAGKSVNLIKSAIHEFDFSSYVYPATSAFGTKVVDATVKQQVSILNGKTDKLINAVIVTKEKNIIEYNTLTNSYEIRTLTPFDKEPSTIVLPSNSIKVLCVQAMDNTYDIQLGIARENALATKLFNNQSASSLTKIRDFVSSYGQGLKFFGNEYNKAWSEIATFVNQVTETHVQIALTNYTCTEVATYYSTHYTTSRYLIFLTETIFITNYLIFAPLVEPDMGVGGAADDGVGSLSQLSSSKLAYSMGVWNGVTAIPSDLINGCALLGPLFSSESWARGIASVGTIWDTPSENNLVLEWTKAVGSGLCKKAANADMCEGAYFSGNIASILASAIFVPETIVDKLVGVALKVTVKLTGTTVKLAANVLSHYTPSTNIKILEIAENYLKVRWKGKEIDIRDGSDIDLVSNSLDENPLTFDDNGIITSDPVLSSKLDELARGVGSAFRGITKIQFFETVAEFKIPSNGLLGDQAWDLWKAKKWGELEDLFKANNINGKWPPNRGFIEFTTEPLFVGKEIDRYGGYIDPTDGLFKDNGLYASPKGASFESRALPAEYLTSTPPKPYNKYKVIKEIPNVKQGQAAPWFNQPGMGTQYELPLSIDKLLSEGFIVKIN